MKHLVVKLLCLVFLESFVLDEVFLQPGEPLRAKGTLLGRGVPRVVGTLEVGGILGPRHFPLAGLALDGGLVLRLEMRAEVGKGLVTVDAEFPVTFGLGLEVHRSDAVQVRHCEGEPVRGLLAQPSEVLFDLVDDESGLAVVALDGPVVGEEMLAEQPGPDQLPAVLGLTDNRGLVVILLEVGVQHGQGKDLLTDVAVYVGNVVFDCVFDPVQDDKVVAEEEGDPRADLGSGLGLEAVGEELRGGLDRRQPVVLGVVLDVGRVTAENVEADAAGLTKDAPVVLLNVVTIGVSPERKFLSKPTYVRS